MAKNKAGAELSVNVIIIAVLALLVLVVLFAVFTGRMNLFNLGMNKLQECPSDTKMVDQQNECQGSISGFTYQKDSAGKKSIKYCCKEK